MRLVKLLVSLAVSMPLAAQYTWQPLAPLPSTLTQFYSVAFDSARSRLHLFDGSAHSVFDGAQWGFSPSPSLFVRRAAYDVVRDRTVVVGEGVGAVGQTWGFDGTAWAQLSPQAPSGACHGLVWHDSRQSIVWFGDGGTFEWDGLVWQPLITTGTPPPASTANSFDVVYDPARGVVAVLRRSAGPLGQAWELSPALDWQPVVVGLPQLTGGRFGFDPVRDRYVAIGTGVSSSVSDEVWERTPGSLDAWHVHAQSPNATGNAPMVWDPAGLRLLVATWSPMGPMLGYSGLNPALYHFHGSGCGGGTLRPLSYEALPYAGVVFDAVINSNSPLGLLATGLDDQATGGVPLPMSLSGLGMGTCMLRVSPDLLTVMLPVAPAVLGGSVQLGPSPASLGVAFYQQAMVFVPGVNPFGAVMTNSMRGVKGMP